MAEPTFAFVIWAGSQQKSNIKCATITNGIAAAIQEVTAKWKSKSYAATVILTGNDKGELIKAMKAYNGNGESEEITENEAEQPPRRKKKTKRTVCETMMQNEMITNEDIDVPPLPPPLSLPCLMVNNNSSTSTVNASATTAPIVSTYRTVAPVTSYRTIPPVTSSFRTVAPVTSSFRTVPPVTSTFRTVPPVTSTFRTVPPITSTFRTLPPVTSAFRTVAPATSTFRTLASVTSTFRTVAPVTSAYRTVAPVTSSVNLVASEYGVFSSGYGTSSENTEEMYYGPSYFTNSLPNNFHEPNNYGHYYGPTSYDLSVRPPFTMEIKRLVKSEVESLEERVRLLEEKLANPSSMSEDDEMRLPTALLYLSREQKLAIQMILAGNTTWTVTLRKILAIVFNQQVLAVSCAKGRPNATTSPLDPQKLNAVKEIIFKSFMREKIQDGAMNVVINSACSGARRAVPK